MEGGNTPTQQETRFSDKHPPCLPPSLPQSLEQWEDSLREAIAVSPPHISLYDLQVEQGTVKREGGREGGRDRYISLLLITLLPINASSSSLPPSLPPLQAFGRWYGKEEGEGNSTHEASSRPSSLPSSSSPLPPEEESASMYARASALLQDAGYVHYEVGREGGREGGTDR